MQLHAKHAQKFYSHNYFVSDPPIFARLRLLSQCSQDFIDETTNCKSSGIDWAAIEPHFTHNQAWLMDI
jgi:hypothetical protein